MISKKIIGMVFVGFGILEGLLNKFSCNRLCKTCIYEQLSPCYFVFTFVGIIFIVVGISLILTLDSPN